MKKILSITFLLFQVGSARANQGRPIFDIKSAAFTRAIEYQANVKGDCTFTEKNPVVAVWKDAAGKTEPLNWLANLVMGMAVDSKEPQKLVGQVKTMKNNNLHWPLTVVLGENNGDCQAMALASDEDQVIEAINVLAFNKAKAPTDIMVIGPVNGQQIQRQVTF